MSRNPEGDMLSRMNHKEVRTVWWEPDAVCLIDQTKLPHTRAVVRCESVEAVAAAIRGMVVRGAPAIGVTAAYGMALAAQKSAATDRTGLIDELDEARKTLDAARPTAVNLLCATIWEPNTPLISTVSLSATTRSPISL